MRVVSVYVVLCESEKRTPRPLEVGTERTPRALEVGTVLYLRSRDKFKLGRAGVLPKGPIIGPALSFHC
jgi:hypothetical protein